MLLIGRHRCRSCAGVSRRALLQVGASSVLGLSLAGLLRLRASAGIEPAAGARSVLLLWLWGGPAQLDTWDPKPNAPLEFRGPFSSIPTRDARPSLRRAVPQGGGNLAERFAILRSLHTFVQRSRRGRHHRPDRQRRGRRRPGRQAAAGRPRPTTGSVVARVRGASPSMPPFMVIGGRLHQGKKAIIGEGGGVARRPLRSLPPGVRPGPRHPLPALQLPADLTPERLADRQRLLQAFDELEAPCRTARPAAHCSTITAARRSPC